LPDFRQHVHINDLNDCGTTQTTTVITSGSSTRKAELHEVENDVLLPSTDDDDKEQLNTLFLYT
jgi:hypothetical protein